MTELGPSTGEIVAMWIAYGVFVVAIGAVGYAMWTEDEDDDLDDVQEPDAVSALPICSYCGRDERDGVGLIVFGMCGDCNRAWSR